MGLDFGTKRIGVALSDELFLTAQAASCIRCGHSGANMEQIRRICAENSVSEIVVGLPLNMDGTSSAKTSETCAFVDLLERSVGIPVRTLDERLTSVQAENVMLEADLSRAKRRKLSDKIAAKFILQSYLDSRAGSGTGSSAADNLPKNG